MVDRASTFADPEIIELLTNNFIPVAFDQWYQRHQKDTAGRFYQKIAAQGPRDDMNQTTQGFYLADSDGRLLEFNNNRGPERIKSVIKRALKDWQAPASTPLVKDNTPLDLPDKKPKRSVVVQVNTRVIEGYQAANDSYQKIMQLAIGRDNLWIFESEIRQLGAGIFPNSLAEKIVRFHAVDNTRGEPPMWSTSEIKSLEIMLHQSGKVSGQFAMATADGERTCAGDILGYVALEAGRLTRFDLVLLGDFKGQGRYTPGAPAGMFPLAVALRIADPGQLATLVRPQALKAFGPGYLHLGSQ